MRGMENLQAELCCRWGLHDLTLDSPTAADFRTIRSCSRRTSQSSKDELERVECIQASDKKVELKSLLTPIRATYLFFTSHL